MHLTRLAFAAVLALAACGGKTGPASVDNRTTTAGADDPVVALEAFAKAIETDDGAAFAALVDPTDGLTLWFTPGAGYAIFETVKPGDTTPPSKHTGADPDREGVYNYRDYVAVAARAIRDGVTKLDREPANPDDEI